jgi:excisionase family DNA binding protein
MRARKTALSACGGINGEIQCQYEIGRLLTVAELANLLRVSRRTVEDWIYRKVIPCTRIGRKPYISTDVLNALLARNAQSAAPGNERVSGSNTKPKEEVQPCAEDNHD